MNLNQKNRKQIRDALLKHAFLPKILQIGLDRQTLAFDVYNTHIRRERADGLSEPWVTRDRVAFRVHVIDQEETFGFDISGRLLRVRELGDLEKHLDFPGWTRDVPGTDRKIALPTGPVTFTVNAMSDSELCRYNDLGNRELRLFEEIRQQAGVIEAMLAAHRTWDKLVRAWPEVEPFKPETVVVQAAKLPAATDLNQSLGLPVGQ